MAGLYGQALPNGSVYFHSVKDPSLFVNGTLIQLQLREPYRDSELNELLYVIVVIVFYATGLMTLIITQIRKQRREGGDVDYYDEYLQRNQEVKRTCRNAITIVTRPPKPKTTEEANVNKVEGASAEEEGKGNGRKKVQTELFPMLEPIPDEDTLGPSKEFQV